MNESTNRERRKLVYTKRKAGISIESVETTERYDSLKKKKVINCYNMEDKRENFSVKIYGSTSSPFDDRYQKGVIIKNKKKKKSNLYSSLFPTLNFPYEQIQKYDCSGHQNLNFVTNIYIYIRKRM